MRLAGLMLLIFFIGQTPAPTPIHTVYDNQWKWTDIKTNWLYVRNDPDQFLQLKLLARFTGKQMPKTGPTALQIEVISHAPKNMYASLPDLIAVADGAELVIGRVQDHPNVQLMGMFKGGKEVGESMANQVSPVPQSAAILAKHKVGDLAAEWVVTDISWEHLTALAKASKIEWKLADTHFSFNEIQLTRVKQFVTAVTPESGVVVTEKRKSETINDKPTRTDTPSDANNTSLKDTLDWLKKQITNYAAGVSVTGEAETLSLTSFDRCTIEYQIVPQNPRRLTLLYSVNLKDLEPAAVELTKSGDRFWMRFSTRDREQSIMLDYKNSQTGNRPYDSPRRLNSATFSLKKNDVGPEMKQALSHAIKLCQ